MESIYPKVGFQQSEIEGFSFLNAETEPLREGDVKREHVRIIGAKRSGIEGHPIVYSDSYSKVGQDEIYAYARHRVDQSKFFSSLDSFLDKTKADLPEFGKQPLPCVLGIRGELSRKHISVPFTHELGPELREIEFLRLSVPFGDMSVEFGEASVHDDQLKFVQKGTLPRKIEFPLFGFDASSDIWVPFLAEIHWASELVARRILENLIRAAIRVGV